MNFLMVAVIWKCSISAVLS